MTYESFSKSIDTVLRDNFNANFKRNDVAVRHMYEAMTALLDCAYDKISALPSYQYTLNGRRFNVAVVVKNPRVPSVQNLLLEGEKLERLARVFNNVDNFEFISDGKNQSLVMRFVSGEIVKEAFGK